MRPQRAPAAAGSTAALYRPVGRAIARVVARTRQLAGCGTQFAVPALQRNDSRHWRSWPSSPVSSRLLSPGASAAARPAGPVTTVDCHRMELALRQDRRTRVSRTHVGEVAVEVGDTEHLPATLPESLPPGRRSAAGRRPRCGRRRRRESGGRRQESGCRRRARWGRQGRLHGRRPRGAQLASHVVAPCTWTYGGISVAVGCAWRSALRQIRTANTHMAITSSTNRLQTAASR